MQYSHPFLSGNTLSNPQYFIQQSINTEIIGEGDVTSLLFPDGTKQYFFQPRNLTFNPTFYKNNYVWIIRSITEPQNIQPISFYNPPPNMPISIQRVEPMEQCYEPIYPLKFHNDGWTSTSDLHYFFPSLRRCEWIPKLAASVQAEFPIEYAPCQCKCNEIQENTKESTINEPKVKNECKLDNFLNVKDSIDVYSQNIKCGEENTKSSNTFTPFTNFLNKPRKRNTDLVYCRCKNSKTICMCGKNLPSTVNSDGKRNDSVNCVFGNNSKITQTSGCACVVKYNMQDR